MSSIYVLRHAQSMANVDPSVYSTTFNQDISLSKEGEQESLEAAQAIQKDSQNIGSIYSSHYLRAIQTANIIGKTLKKEIKQHTLLSERHYGEQEGCSDVENFANRPQERSAYNKTGHLNYKPNRGESLIDVQVRTSLFILLQDSFRYVPASIIVSHASTCMMFHASFTGEMPTAQSKWANCEIRKYTYTAEPSTPFICEGIIK